MASISLPTPGQKPWDLNAPITAINNQLNSLASDVSTRLSEEALSTKIADFVDSRGGGLKDTGETVAARMQLRSGDIRIGIAGDSTGNASDEHFDLLIGKLAAADTNRRVEILSWLDGSQTYAAATVVQPGGAYGSVFRDTFTRTAADLTGTAPDLGPVWQAGSAATGDWTVDGADAVKTADATIGLMLAPLSAARTDQKLIASGSIAIENTGTGYYVRFVPCYLDASNHILVAIAVSSTGVATLQLSKRTTAGGLSVIQSMSDTGFTNAVSGAQEFSVSFERAGSTVTAVFTTPGGTRTLTGTLTSADVTALSGAEFAGLTASRQGIKIHAFEVQAPGIVDRVLRAYNASRSGSILTYQQERVAAMYPLPLDMLIISSSHNYGSSVTPTQYLAAIDAFIAAFRAVQPTAPIVISSQNPRFAPATGVAAHQARIAALRSYAAQKGYGYIPIGEAFLARPDWQSLIEADGVHPTVGPNSGSALWASVDAGYFEKFGLALA